MVTEPTPSPAGAPEGAQPQATTTVCTEAVVTLQSIALMYRSYALYRAALRGNAKFIEDAKLNKTMMKRLKSMDALLILFSIYAYSDFVTDDVRRAVGLSPAACIVAPTCNSLKATLMKEFAGDETADALRIETSRIIQAAILLGFVVIEDRPTRKPLRATERLQKMMTDTGVDAALLVRDAVNNRG